MKYYCNPLNIEYKYQIIDDKQDNKRYINREAADPSLVEFKGLYYLFPSMTAGFLTSKDLLNWDFHEFINEMPIYDYAPDVRVVDDYIYFSASKREKNCSFYRTKDPINEPFEEIEGSFPFWDPNLFYDDNKLYLYWGCSNITPIYGVELDKETMKPKSDPITLIDSKTDVIGYERNGEDHNPPKTKEQIEKDVQNIISQYPDVPEDRKATLYKIMGNDPYIEGAWVNKYKGKYYLQYAIPGTQYNIYCDGVYVSDKPLGPYKLAENNPFSYKPGGFINGAGHGSTMKDLDDNFWHISTMSISMNHKFERRLGLWKAGFDIDDELFCDQRYADWPIRVDQKPWEGPDWMILSYECKTEVSSGKGSEFITDENIRTWWSANSNKPGEWALIDLGKEYDIRAIQINFADYEIDADVPKDAKVFEDMSSSRYIDQRKAYTRWILEASKDGDEYFVVENKSKTETDLAHDFVVREKGIKARYIRLTIKEVPYNQNPKVSGLRVFGLDKGDLPKKVSNVKYKSLSDLDLEISWEKDSDTVGYNVLWGHKADKLYHSYMVFDKNKQKIGALIKNKPLYFRVDSFNRSGITEGEVTKV